MKKRPLQNLYESFRERHGLNPSELAVFGALSFFQCDSEPTVIVTIPMLASDCSLSKRQVQRAVGGLIRKRLIDREQGLGRGNVSRYSLKEAL